MFKWLALKPARTLGMTNRGAIEEGKYADLVIWQPEKFYRVISSHSKYPETCAYHNEELFGEVQHVWLRGHLAYTNQTFAAPIGQLLKQESLFF
jgi:allantoinase